MPYKLTLPGIVRPHAVLTKEKDRLEKQFEKLSRKSEKLILKRKPVPCIDTLNMYKLIGAITALDFARGVINQPL